jgi:hypothetical protein
MRSSKHTACSENGHGRSHAAPPRIRRVAGRAGLGPAPTWTSTIRHSRFTIHHSPFAIRHSPFFSIRHSLFAIRGFSPLAARCSLRAVGVHKRRLADTSADCRGTACRAPTPCLPTGPCARAAWLFAAGDGPPGRCQRHNTTRAGLGPAPARTSTVHHSPFAVFCHSRLATRPGRWLSTNGGSPTHPRTVGARHAVPLHLAYPQVRVHERPGSSRRAMVRRQDAGATTQPGRVWDPPLPRPVPFTIRDAPFADAAVHSARAQQRCAPTNSHHSPFAIRHSLYLTIRHSLFAVLRDSPFAVFFHSPFAIRYSLSFAARHSPNCAAALSLLGAALVEDRPHGRS